MTNPPKGRASNVIPFPTVSEDEAHKAGMVEAWEEMLSIAFMKLAEARQELAEARLASQTVAVVAMLLLIPSIAQAENHAPQTDDSALYRTYRVYLIAEQRHNIAIAEAALHGWRNPTLQKKAQQKERAASKARLEAQQFFYRVQATTADGMILKLTFGWSREMWSAWRINGHDAKVKFHPAACPSVLMDLETWMGRREWPAEESP